MTSARLDPGIERLLRDLAPQVLGPVVRRFRNFAACEDAVQEALIAAAERWPREGLPSNPRGWLIHVAVRRKLADDARRNFAHQKAFTFLPSVHGNEMGVERDNVHRALRFSAQLQARRAVHPDFPSARQPQDLDYRPAIDGLRGIAVLAVLGFHAFPEYVPGGFVGVDVFFVISGFLITGIIARQLQRGAFSFADFYARRIRRLFPSLVLVLAATLVVGWLVLLPDELQRLGKHIVAAALFAANVAFWRESGYFDVETELKPLLHLWSLGVEEQFYFLWPVLLVLLWKRRSLLLIVLSTLVLGSFVLSVGLASAAPSAGFYSPFSRFWELGFGCLLALLQKTPAQTWRQSTAQSPAVCTTLWNLLPIAGLILIGASMFILDGSTPFPSWRALLPVAGTLLILCAPERGWLQRRVLGGPILVYVGLISYALYLWHWPLLSFAHILQAGPVPIDIRWTLLLLGFVLASLTYHFAEVPIRRRKAFKVNLGLMTGAALAGLSGLAVYATVGVPARFNVDVQALQHGPRADDLCKARIGGDRRINYCRSTSAQPPNIVVLGDSKAQAVYEATASLFAAEYSVMLLARGGCPPLLNVRIRGYDSNERECGDVWRRFVSYVQRVRPEVVIVVGNGSFLLTNPEIELTRVGARSAQSKEAVFEHGLRSLMRELARSSRVVHVGEIPGFDTHPACFLRRVKLPTTHCSPDRDRLEIESAMSKYNAVLHRMQPLFPDVRFVNSVAILCTGSLCSQWPSGGPVLYSDAIHLSPAGGRLLINNAGLQHIIAPGGRIARTG